MGKILKKKGECGAATSYLSRKQALKKLQLSLKDFRRLCILKGIYPTEPRHKRKVNKKNSSNKTYYYLKDIQFLLHEPIIEKFREIKVFVKRLKRTIGRQDQEASQRLRMHEPSYRVDHIVKERYPTFLAAVRDIDDAISMCFLFSTVPKSRIIKTELVDLCRKLTVEFMHYVIQARALKKVFISIKGFYYQAEIMGEVITWIVPHALGYSNPSDVDFKVMLTFTEFYSTMLGFVNYKLYNSLNLMYPPKLSADVTQSELLAGEDANEYAAALNQTLKAVLGSNVEEEVQPDDFSESADKDVKKRDEEERLKKLFEGYKFFLNREVPLESLVFIIRSFGGVVSYDKMVSLGATYDETDVTITHHIIDRPAVSNSYMNRYYVQPQWVYDSVNARKLLPVDEYFPGEALPPHLSPFVEEKDGDYIPPEKLTLLGRMTDVEEEESSAKQPKKTTTNKKAFGKRQAEEDSEEEPDKAIVVPGSVTIEDAKRLKQSEAAEEKRLALLMMPKKRKHLYNKIIYGQKRQKREALKLKEKRITYDLAQKVNSGKDF